MRRLGPAPLVPVALGLVAGIGLDATRHVPLAWVAVGLVGAAACLIVGRRWGPVRWAAVAMAAASLGAVRHDLAFRRVASDHLARFLTGGQPIATIEGTIVDEPLVYQRPGGHFARWLHGRMRTRIQIEADRIKTTAGGEPVSGRLQVYVKAPILTLRAGQRVRAVGRLFMPMPPSNPGEFDRAAMLQRRGVLVGLSCKYASAVEVLDEDADNRSASIRSRCRDAVRRSLYDHLPPVDEPASVLQAIVLGQRSGISEAINDAFVHTGTAHFLAVSGTHVGMLAVFVGGLAWIVGAGRRVTAVIVFLAVAGYVFVAEPRVPILRAGLLCTLGCIAVGLRRPTSPMNWLAAGAIVLLLWRPCDLFGAGFQLSFGVVLGILLLAPMFRSGLRRIVERIRGIPAELEDPWMQRPRWRRIRGSIGNALAWLLAVSVAAWLVGSMLTACHFQQFSPWGWLNSMLVWPLVMLVVIGGFTKLMLAAAWPQTTVVTGPIVGGVTQVMIGWVEVLSAMPGVSVTIRSPSVLAVGLYLGGLAALAMAWRSGWRACQLGAIALLPLAGIALWLAPPEAPDDHLDVWTLDVGSGQAIVVRMPGRRTWLIDAGTISGYDVGEATIVPALRSLGVGRIDTAVISHANFDHYSGILAVDDHMPIRRVLTNPRFVIDAEGQSAGRFLLAALERRGIPIETACAEQTMAITEGVTLDVLWPPAEVPAAWESNDTSLVVRLSWGGRTILIGGDIGDLPQQALAERADVQSDVLVMPHHGAVVRHTGAFIGAVDPSIVVRSDGGMHRRNASFVRAVVEGRRYLNTATDGAIHVRLGADGVVADAPFDRDGRCE